MNRSFAKLGVCLLVASSAFAVPVIQVFPSIGPNAFDSPSYGAYATNAIGALLAGASTNGVPGTPAYYTQFSGLLGPYSILITAPPETSWNGVANPTGAFAGEYGNMIYFGLRIEDTSTKFSLSQLSLTDNLFGDASTCPAPCYANYRTDLVGIDYGGNGVLGGGDDTTYTSGASTQLVNLLLYRGNALAFNASFYGTGQAALDAAAFAVQNASIPSGQRNANTTYSLGTAGTVSSTVNFSADIPEPATYTLMLAGLVAGMILRRRQ